jgi:lysophospholipase L1-like esterase
MNWETYMALGDSITIGARTYLGYPEIAGTILSSRLNKQWNVINHAVSGFKAIDLVRYIDQHYINLKEQKSSITTILIGSNDIKESTQLEDYCVALNLAVLKAKLITQNYNVVLILLPSFPVGIMYPYTYEMNEAILTFNQAIIKIAGANHLKSIHPTVEQEGYHDGIHLNPVGLMTMGNEVAQFILRARGLNNE